MAGRKRTRRTLGQFERDTARVLLADGLPAADVAKRLDVDVRALDDLLSGPLASERSDLDRALVGYRNAVLLFESERDRLLRFQKLVPGDIPGNGQRDKAVRYLDCTRQHAEAARKQLETVHKWAETLAKLGGSVVADGRVVEIPVSDRPELGDGLSDGSADGEDGAGD